jgi:hypothetical protein
MRSAGSSSTGDKVRLWERKNCSINTGSSTWSCVTALFVFYIPYSYGMPNMHLCNNTDDLIKDEILYINGVPLLTLPSRPPVPRKDRHLQPALRP